MLTIRNYLRVYHCFINYRDKCKNFFQLSLRHGFTHARAGHTVSVANTRASPSLHMAVNKQITHCHLIHIYRNMHAFEWVCMKWHGGHSNTLTRALLTFHAFGAILFPARHSGLCFLTRRLSLQSASESLQSCDNDTSTIPNYYNLQLRSTYALAHSFIVKNLPLHSLTHCVSNIYPLIMHMPTPTTLNIAG